MFTSIFGAVTTVLLGGSGEIGTGIASAGIHFATAVMFYDAAVRAGPLGEREEVAELQQSFDELRAELRTAGHAGFLVLESKV